MNIISRLINTTIRTLTGVLCRIDAPQLTAIPEKGPLILISNHINFLEVPVLYTRLMPRPITGFAKTETWDNALMGRLFDMWGIIPLKRGTADIQAVRRGLSALKAGSILVIAPEGTRSHDGVLRLGLPGVVLMALHSGAPVLPIACHGNETFWDNLRGLRRTDFRIEVGNPFYLKGHNAIPSRNLRTEMLSEIMCQLAALLPAPYRGAYANLSTATEAHLEFPSWSESNLSKVCA